MADHNEHEDHQPLTRTYDDEMQDGVVTTEEEKERREAEEMAVDYDLASKVAPAMGFGDLNVTHLQAIVIAHVGVQHEAEIRRITDKDHLIRLVTYLQKPNEPNEGLLPRTDVVEIPFRDLSCNFTEKEVIGSGGFSKVYRGSIYFTPCAIKVTKTVDPRVLQKLIPSLRKEIEIMRNSHPNVCSLLGICRNGNNLYICMELMAGNLEKYLKNRPNLLPTRRMDIVEKVGRGLNWLHNQKTPILHLDLKLENVLHDENGVMKLTDFGLSAILSQDASYVEAKTRAPGNVGHMSPEVIMMQKFNEKADVYGFGVLIWEILKGYEWETEVVDQLVEMGIDTSGQLRTIVKSAVCDRNLRPRVDRCPWPDRLKNLLKRMWHGRPEQRPYVREVLESDLGAITFDFAAAHIRRSMVDEQGQNFWTRYYSSKIDEPIQWAEFKVKFYEFMGLRLPKNEDDRTDPPVRQLLYFKLALNSIQSNLVSLESFGKVCDAFGPVIPRSTSFLDTLQVTCSNRWFRPELSQDQAKEYLHGQDDGTFIVRFSSKIGCPFTLSRVFEGKIHQTRIYREADGFSIGEENSRWKKIKFSSLMDIMSNPRIIEAFKLENYPVIRVLGPGEKLMLAPLVDTNYAPELNNSGMLEELLALSMQQQPNLAQEYSFLSGVGQGSSSQSSRAAGGRGQPPPSSSSASSSFYSGSSSQGPAGRSSRQ